MPDPSPLYRWPDLPRLVVLALAYAASMWVAYRYLLAEGIISRVWIPSGLGLAALVAGGTRYWPAILVRPGSAGWPLGRT